MNIQDIKNIQSILSETLNVFIRLGFVDIDKKSIQDLYNQLDNIDYSVFSKIIEESPLSIVHDYNKAYFYLKSYLVDDPIELLPPNYNFHAMIERMGLNETALNDIIELWKLFEGVIFSIKSSLSEVFAFIEDTKLKECEHPIIAEVNKLNQIFVSSDRASQRKEEQNNINKPVKKERTIKEAELKEYFTLAFRGRGNGNIDYFENLLGDLKKDWNDKDFARIANMIYNSKKLAPSMRPSTFIEWYKKFCELVEFKFHGYKPNALKPDDSLKNTFYYL